ncbi:MAG: chemotaxis protein CheW [Desulfobacterales bacterium]|nr:chemotaxis protein CheW [Desulfobacterales bacterium]
MPEQAYHPYTVIIIVTVNNKSMGVIVDSVSDVIFIDKKHIQPVDLFASSTNTKYIHGIVF